MIIRTIKTEKLTGRNKGLFDFVDKYIKKLDEKSVVVLTSKIISILEGRVMKKEGIPKADLIAAESDQYLVYENEYWHKDFVLSIKNNLLIPNGGIDESNAFDNYILWPKDPYGTAKKLWKYWKDKFKLKNLGVIITDSKTTPMRWGTTGVSIGYCGFSGLNSYIGKNDIFGKKMEITKANIADGLAAAGVVAMGEGKEQTPIAIITGFENIKFKKTATSKSEIKNFSIAMNEDIYSPLLMGVKWIKGGVSNRT